MRYRAARRAIVENELGRLEQELAGLRVLKPAVSTEPFARLDIVPGVMRAIERLPRTDRRDVPARQLGGASAVAALLALFLVPGFLISVPELSRLLPAGRGLSLALGHLLDRGLALGWTLLGLAGSLLHGLVEAVGVLGSTLMLMEPAARAAAIAGYTAMALTVLAVVGHDLIRGERDAPIARKER